MSRLKYGRWTILGPSECKKQFVHCRCDCGTDRDVYVQSLRSGRSTSCGCSNIRHGHARKRGRLTAEYQAWCNMRARCYKPSYRSYQRYGGRGIGVCQRWRESFENFLTDVGPKPSPNHSLGRIDNDGDYCPENCRWETQAEQSLNTSRKRLITYRGVTKHLFEWATELGLTAECLRGRFRQGWSLDDAMRPQTYHRWNSPNRS